MCLEQEQQEHKPRSKNTNSEIKKKIKKTMLTKCKLHISDLTSLSHQSYPFPFLYLFVLKPKTQAFTLKSHGWSHSNSSLRSSQQLSKSISHSRSHILGTSAWLDLNGPHRSTLATTILVIASPSLLHPQSQPLSLSLNLKTQDPSFKMNLSQTSNFNLVPRRS